MEGYEENDFLNYSYEFQSRERNNLYDYDYDRMYQSIKSLDQKYGRNNISWNNFANLIESKRIRISKKPVSTLGWFLGEESSVKDDINYTFEKYLEGISKNKKYELLRGKLFEEKRQKSKQRFQDQQREERNKKIFPTSPTKLRKSFKKNSPKIVEIFKKYVINDEGEFNALLNRLLFDEKISENETRTVLIQEAKRKYNFENDKNNKNIKKFSFLSKDMKEKTRIISEHLKDFYKNLKPFLKEYDDDNPKKPEIIDFEKEKWKEAIDRENELKDKNLKEYNKLIQKDLPKRNPQEEARIAMEEEKRRTEKLQQRKEKIEREKMNEQIEDLEYKISDAQSKYSINRAKLRKLDSKLKNLKNLEKRKSELQEKLRKKNLKIEERQQLLKEKTELNEKLKNIENLEDQVADLKSKIPSLSVFEQEKIMRKNELQKLKNLNNASIREKNALFKSIELEKIKIEITLREEQRYQEEQREKEELKQAKIVFLKEKKIAERKLNEFKISEKMKNDKIIKLKKIEQDLNFQKIYFEKIKAEKQSALKEKKLQIEQKKLRTLEIEKQELLKKQDYAEQQKLFADSIQRDIDDLNSQKNILQNITLNNEKIKKNTKDEINKRQQEIEKTIKLNIASMKKRESNILSEEAKIKLDVFYTLEDVKDQTAKKLDLEKKMQDLKDEIIRKQDVTELLNETVEKISNTEISEAEEYNAFLESEIAFKKKLAKENLNLAEYKEIIADEKEDLIDRLEHVKSQKLKKIYQLREKAIETQMKIILLEGAEDLKNNLFSLKYEIENLEKEKEISERKEDLAKFQSDNFKRELNLLNQEIKLLKNIRLKVLQKERLDARNEASKAIIDIVKKEEQQAKQDVREKLDEIIDDVETKEISRKSKAALFSMIDKIEDENNKQAAKEKINFILGKIELHENIEESRKKLDEFFKNKQIQKDVSEKLDEILDDIEFDDDDYDFLDEDDHFDEFLSSIKKHISGEKKLEQFSKIDTILEETRKEDSKLKMSENIEMKDRGRQVAPEDYEVGETSFDEFNDYNFFINNIEDPFLKEKTRNFLGDIDGFEKEEEKIPKIKNAYKQAVNKALWDDKLDTDYWDGNIILEERAKLLYEQKVNNINTALGDYNVHIDPTDQKVREFLDIKVTETTSEKRGEINGYMYNGEKIISRNISRNFYFNYIKKPALCQKFINELKGPIEKTAKSQIANESYFDGESVKDCAMEYIGELREEQSYQIDSARNAKEMRDALREANDIDKEIKDIKKNMSFKMRMKIFRRTLSWRFTKLLRLLWKHKLRTSAIVFSIFSAAIGILLNQLGVIAVVHNLKKAARSVHQYANDVHEMGKRIIQNFKALYGIPGKIGGFFFIGVGIFLQVLYFFTRLSGTYSSAIVFEVFGTLIQISLIFSGNLETINEKTVEVLEETGNFIENAGIRAQKQIAKNMPRWYYDKPVEERTILQNIEAGTANVMFQVAKGTEYTGKKVQDAGEVMKNTLWYMQAFLIVAFSLLVLIFIRSYVL